MDNSKLLLCVVEKTGVNCGYLRFFYIQKILSFKINNKPKLSLKTDLFIGDALFKRRTFSKLYQGNYTIKTN